MRAIFEKRITFTDIPVIIEKTMEILQMTLPQGNITVLLDLQALMIPPGIKQVFACEHRADVGMMHIHAPVVAGPHDVQQRLQGRAGILDAATVEVAPGDALLSLNDVVYAIDVYFHPLGLGFEDLFGEDRPGIVENLAHEVMHEMSGDAVTQTTGEYRPALVLDVLQRLQVAVADEVGRIALLRGKHQKREDPT